MGLQPFYGNEISEEFTAAVDLEYYILVTYHATDKTKVIPATAGTVPLAITVPSEDDRMPDGQGNMIKRTKYRAGETPTLYDIGTVWIKLGETVTPGQECVPGLSGYGYAKDNATFTDSDLTAPVVPEAYAKADIDTALATYNTAVEGDFNGLIDEIQAALLLEKSVFGRFRRGGDAGDIVPLKIN
jgi:hypothetical protein